ncbi:hypothetical protein LB504_003639 [Fusarium proliferatum]|nr:hypothetical protein LB504_003639 [Fusarium proliferatum]
MTNHIIPKRICAVPLPPGQAIPTTGAFEIKCIHPILMAGSALVEMIIATTGVRDGFRWMSTQVSDTSETWVLVQPLMRKVDDDYRGSCCKKRRGGEFDNN